MSNMKMVLRPFHEKCFKEHVKMKREQASMFFDAMPLNGTYGQRDDVDFLIIDY